MTSSSTQYCQGPVCHMYETKDRLRGPKGNKTYQTRKRGYLLNDMWCDLRCKEDYFNLHQDTIRNAVGVQHPIKRPEDSVDFYQVCRDNNLEYYSPKANIMRTIRNQQASEQKG